jgi:hypothetical protein
MKRRMPVVVWTLLVVVIGLATNLRAENPTVIGRFDLDQRADFDRFNNLGITPFFRIGNVFFAEADREQLVAAREAKIAYEVVDENPFSRPYYTGLIESLPSRKIPAPDLELLLRGAQRAGQASIPTLRL